MKTVVKWFVIMLPIALVLSIAWFLLPENMPEVGGLIGMLGGGISALVWVISKDR